MNDLSHWDYVDRFRANEIAALILGFEPGEVPSSMDRAFLQIKFKVKTAFLRPLEDYRARHMEVTSKGGEVINFCDSDLRTNLVEELIALSKSGSTQRLLSYVWQLDDENFEIELFSRAEIARWLTEIKLRSSYVFDPNISQKDESLSFDPEDRPDELDLANIAWQAVKNGYGDQDKNFKKRLLEFLDKNRPDLSKEARDRIAVVANSDKKPGPKRIDY